MEQLSHFKDDNEPHHLRNVTSKITFTTNLDFTLEGAIIVQENGPENLATKCDLLRRLDDSLDASVPILTSTSGLTCSSMQVALAKHPE